MEVECEWRVWNKVMGMYWCINPWDGDKPCECECWRLTANKVKLPSWSGERAFLVKRGTPEKIKEIVKIALGVNNKIAEYYYHDLAFRGQNKYDLTAKLFFENKEKADIIVVYESVELLEGYAYFKNHNVLLYYYHFHSASGSPITQLYQLYSL